MKLDGMRPKTKGERIKCEARALKNIRYSPENGRGSKTAGRNGTATANKRFPTTGSCCRKPDRGTVKQKLSLSLEKRPREEANLEKRAVG